MPKLLTCGVFRLEYARHECSIHVQDKCSYESHFLSSIFIHNTGFITITPKTKKLNFKDMVTKLLV